MGLGKTIQAIAALRLMFYEGDIRRVLIVTPSSLLLQWRRELHAWAPELEAIRVDGPSAERLWKWRSDKQVFLASYETVRADLVTAAAVVWDILVLDEAQRIKHRQAATSQACKRLPRRRSWALTGTPLENSEDDLASVLEFVRPNPQGDRLPPLFPGFRLRSMQTDHQLRRRKADVLSDLPPKMIVPVTLELTAAQREAYRETESRGTRYLANLGDRATVVNVLELITHLKQICNFCPTTGSSSKLEDLRDRMSSLSASGHRALVFSQWTHDRYGVGRLARELQAFRPLAYVGTLGQEQRAACIDAFKRDPLHRVLLLSLRAGGQGLNLQEASYVFHFDRWWNPAVENQATDRAHRMGQQNAVTVYTYTCAETIEERIQEILDRKRALFAALVDHVSMDVRRLLTAEELFDLVGVTLPARLHPPQPASADIHRAAERVEYLLQRSGWDVHRRGSSLDATRLDEIGEWQEVHVRCIPVWDDRVLDLPPRTIIVCLAGLPAWVRPTARDRGIGVMSLDELTLLEQALL